MLALLKTIFYVPLYNGLLFLIAILPSHSAGVAVILLTLVVKLLLFPLSQKATKFQLEMKTHEDEINRIKARFKDDKQAQGKAVLDFYREKNINPFAAILPLFIQIPIVIALYYVFFKGGLPIVDDDLVYSFVPIVEPDMHLVGFNILDKSIILAVLAGATQFLQGYLVMPPIPSKGETPSLGSDLARGMHLQMKYAMPVVMAFVAYAVSGAVALYFITSNLFTVAQELYLRRRFKKQGHLTHNKATLSPPATLFGKKKL